MAAEYRVSGSRLRRNPDPETSADPGIVAVLEALRALPAPPAPRADFRAELRAQLVAITPRIIAESVAEAPVRGTARTAEPTAVGVLDRPRPTPRPRPNGVAPARRAQPRESIWAVLRDLPIGRPLAMVASLVTVAALILGGAVWMSQDSLPGDTLYGLKRASERFELSRTDNDTERAKKLLQFATTRVDEARQLVSRPSASAAGTGPLADGQLSSQTSSLVSETLASANDDTRTASRLLGGAAVAKASASPLAGVGTWASEQLTRLSRLRDSIPTDARARTSATESADLVQAVATRTAELQQRVSCRCLTTAPSDALGPVPGTAVTAPRSTTPAPPARTSRPTGSTGGSTSSSAPRTSGSSSSSGGGKASTSAPAGRTTAPPKQVLPTLTIPTAPATTHKPLVDLCKVTLLGVRLCPSSTP